MSSANESIKVRKGRYFIVLRLNLTPAPKCFLHAAYNEREVNHEDGPVLQPSALDDHLGARNTSTCGCRPSSVSGEAEQNAYMRVQQVSNDIDLMWCKQDR